MPDTGVTMPRMWALRDLRTQGGLSSDDLLVEITDITFATTTAYECPTMFADGQILAVIVCSQAASAVRYSSDKAVTSAAVTITSSVTNNTETVTVIVIGKAQI